MIERRTSSFEERADIVRQPQRGENCGHGASEAGGEMILRHHQRYVLWHAVVSPDLKDVLHQLRLLVESLPGDGARLERIVLERNEGQVEEPAVCFQIIYEAPHPRCTSLGI